MKRTLLIGIGNGFRKDDGVGLEIAQRIEELNLPGMTVAKSTGDLTNFISILREYKMLIIADSIKSTGNPGMNIRVDISELQEDFNLSPNISTHWLGILETLGLANSIGNLPEKTIIYGIEGADFSHGIGISPELLSTVELIVDEIISDLEV